jgi:hypothetical protein
MEMALFFPTEAVKKDAKWKNKFEKDLGLGKISGIMEFQYLGEESRNGKKLDKFTVKPSFKFEAAENAQVPVKITDLKVKEAATYFNRETGRVEETTQIMDMVMSVEVGGTEINFNNQVSTITRLKTK